MGFIWLNSKLGVPVNQEYENLPNQLYSCWMNFVSWRGYR